MKTKILRLEPHDDFISARDKMGWSQTERILLVWPEDSHILTRRLDLTLLQRHSKSLGAQLALVSKNSDVLYNARLIGIPVFQDIQSAQISHWRVNRRKLPPSVSLTFEEKSRPDLNILAQEVHPPPSKILSQPAARLIFFTLGVLALLSIAAILVPRATIALTPETRAQELILLVQAKPDITSVNLSGDVPARLAKVEVEGRSRLQTSGSTAVPLDYAKGQLRFTNLTDRSMTIPPLTVVRTSGSPPIRFATTSTANIPAGVGEAITVTVQALEPGISGNIPSNQLIAIEGDLGASLTSTNPRPTSGGSERNLAIATDENRELLFTQLSSQLRKTAQEELTRLLPAGDILFTPTITVSQVIEQNYDPPENLPSDEIGLNLRLEFQALTAVHSDLEQLANYALDANLPSTFIAIPETITIDSVAKPTINENGWAEWKIRARRVLNARIPASEVIRLVMGTPPSLALRKLTADLPISDQPEISLTPSWWPRLPFLPFRYDISIQQ